MAESVVKYSYNGTEYSFVTKDPAQIEDLKCPICLELVHEPVLTSCGHLFCEKCVRGQSKCPTCRDKLPFMRNQFNARKKRGLKVQCLKSINRCMWQLRPGGHHTQHASGTNFQCEGLKHSDAYTATMSMPLMFITPFASPFPSSVQLDVAKYSFRAIKWLNILPYAQRNLFHANMLRLDVMIPSKGSNCWLTWRRRKIITCRSPWTWWLIYRHNNVKAMCNSVFNGNQGSTARSHPSAGPL